MFPNINKTQYCDLKQAVKNVNEGGSNLRTLLFFVFILGADKSAIVIAAEVKPIISSSAAGFILIKCI